MCSDRMLGCTSWRARPLPACAPWLSRATHSKMLSHLPASRGAGSWPTDLQQSCVNCRAACRCVPAGQGRFVCTALVVQGSLSSSTARRLARLRAPQPPSRCVHHSHALAACTTATLSPACALGAAKVCGTQPAVLPCLCARRGLDCACSSAMIARFSIRASSLFYCRAWYKRWWQPASSWHCCTGRPPTKCTPCWGAPI